MDEDKSNKQDIHFFADKSHNSYQKQGPRPSHDVESYPFLFGFKNLKIFVALI